MTLNETAGFLRARDGYLIFTHKRPDGDACGSAAALCLGLRAVGKTAYVAENPEAFGRLKQLVIGLFPPDGFAPETVLSVDTADIRLLPEEWREEEIELSIDHHPDSRPYAKRLLLDRTAAATGELITLLMNEMNISITKEMAEALYIAITTDTGCLRYANTTSRTLRVAADLKDTGINTAEINTDFFEKKPKSRFALEAELLRDIKQTGKTALAFLTLEKIDIANAAPEDADNISSLPRQIEGVEIGVTLREEPDCTTKISVRTSANYSARKICALMDGGGHERAAGCLLHTGIQEAGNAVLESIGKLYPSAL